MNLIFKILLKTVTFLLYLSVFAFYFHSTAFAVSKSWSKPNEQAEHLSSMAKPSEEVIVGRVVSQSSRWVGKVIVTTANVKPVEVLKGAKFKGSLKVSYIGGTVGVIRQTLSDHPTLIEGETAVLYLKRAPTKSPLSGSHIFSHSEGKISLLNANEDVKRLSANLRLKKLIRTVRANIQ